MKIDHVKSSELRGGGREYVEMPAPAFYEILGLLSRKNGIRMRVG
jgi:hypothetical protein